MLDRLTIERMTAAAGDGPILLALSGGGDSVALLHLLVERLGAARLRAAIVDHALRAGSADDARRALAFATALGVDAAILRLAWPAETANRAQRAARQGRYTVLCAHARAIGARVIAAAHTADDQAETVLMRAAAGSSWRGLAGMAMLAPVPLWPEGRDLLLGRPLLGARRTALREMLRRRGASWIEDPANANPAFQRVRVRAVLRALAGEGLDPMRLARLAERLRSRVEALDRAAAALIERAVVLNGSAEIARASWQGPQEARARALAVVMAAVAGAPREPPAPAIAELEARLSAPDFPGATHGGVRFHPARGGAIRLTRDSGAALGRADGAAPPAPLPLPVGEEQVWDGRIALTAQAPGWRAVADDNPDLVVLEKGAERRRLAAAEEAVHACALLRAHIAHALAVYRWQGN